MTQQRFYQESGACEMTAKLVICKGKNDSRTVLADVVPLGTPFLVQIFPVYACNFKCNFCLHSIPPSQRGYVADKTMMNFELYKKTIDDLLQFPQKIKMLRFAATGEPLLHPQISEMIEYANKKNVANSIEIVTNASLLNKELSDKLISSKLDWLRISIEGLSSKKYKDICNTDIDFEMLVENIKYFYENKKNTKVYIKIIDCALEEGEEEKFYKMFSDICDRIAIEHLCPVVNKIDYSKLSNKDLNLTQNGNIITEIKVCPQPFFMLQVNPEGNIVPCCSMLTPIILGNCEKNSIKDIWNGENYKKFQILQLNKQKEKNKVCKDCQSYKYGTFKEDILDNKLEIIKTKMGIL